VKTIIRIIVNFHAVMDSVILRPVGLSGYESEMPFIEIPPSMFFQGTLASSPATQISQ
jgi:hypothetical protein